MPPRDPTAPPHRDPPAPPHRDPTAPPPNPEPPRRAPAPPPVDRDAGDDSTDDAARRAQEAWEHAARARENARQLRQESQALVDGLEAGLRGSLARNPYAVLGAAAAAGYVLSAGVPRWAVRLAVSAGSRWLIDAAVGQILASSAPPQRRRRGS